MGTEILKSFGNLQSDLEQAKSCLKGVDENIKRLIGRDPSEIIPPQPINKRGLSNGESDRSRPSSQVISRSRNFGPENNDPSNRRPSVFKRLSDKPFEDDIWIHPPKQLISKVIVTPREVPSRLEVLASRRTDEKSKARNKRMFGALLGTLQKFQQEETRLKSKEQKRAKVEKKIEDLEIKEKAEIKKERQDLFFNRRKKLVEIKIIEIKMMRMREFSTWEQRIRPRSNFILSKSKPHIPYLPRRLNDASKLLLASSKTDVEKMIQNRKDEVFAELQRIEERITKNFELRNPKDEDTIHKDDEKNGDKMLDETTKNDFVNEVCEAEIQDILNKVENETEGTEEHTPFKESRSYTSTEEMEVGTVEATDVDTNNTCVNDTCTDDSKEEKEEQNDKLCLNDVSKCKSEESD